MRPIDADAIIDLFLMRPTEEFMYKRQFTAEDVALIIKSAPTVDTVKHGHWERKKDLCYCSACGKLSARFILMSNYCARCGAKMDEEVEE